MSYEPDSWQRPATAFPAPPAPQSPTPPTPPMPTMPAQVPPTVGDARVPTGQSFPPPSHQERPPSTGRSGAGRKVALGVVAVAAMVGSGVVGAVVATSLDGDDDRPVAADASEVSVALGGARGDVARIDVAAVADHVAPSVVTISTDVEGPLSEVGHAVGTGVITTSDGEILTNAHVIEGATEIRVRLAGESEPRRATLLASDPGNDLALISIAGDGYTPATFAQPDTVRIGDEVVAIGFALDLDGDPSVTLGIVSALDRTIDTGTDVFLDGLIQTDAAISSGNSGGPLVNAAGEVVGINTAVARGDLQTAASNIGFAISVREVLPVIENLREQADGELREDGYLGVELAERTDGGQGSVVEHVEPGTPADDAGLLPGDIVIEVDGSPINGTTGLVAAIRDREPGERIEILVVRDGETVVLEAVLAARTDG